MNPFRIISSGISSAWFRKLAPALAIAMLAVSFMGCEEDVNPFIGTEFPYTVWGFVNPKADTHAVRVFTIDEILQIIPADPLDADVSIVRTDDNQRFPLSDSLIALPEGDFRHVFWSRFDVEFGQSYRVEVERSDGVMTRSSAVKVPPLITINTLDPDVNTFTELLLPFEIEGGPPSMPRIDATYIAFSATGDGVIQQANTVSLPYHDKPVFRNGVWMLDIDLRADFEAVRSDFNEKEIQGFICVDRIQLDVHVTNEEWRSPIGDFDPDFLVEPGVLTNVENGFGLFGAGYIESVSVTPPNVMLVRAGFFDCFGGG